MKSDGNKKKIFIVKPAESEWLENHAVNELGKYLEIITGTKPLITDDKSSSGIPNIYFVLGSGNSMISGSGAGEKVREHLSRLNHPESYFLVSMKSGNTGYVFLAGKNPVGTLYAVYEYLERFCGAGFFQDGEHVPALEELPVSFNPVVETPRFDNRLHLAWNAHRAIKKYHSFWWDLDDWKRELEWMTKRRVNMLRLDMAYYSRFAGDAFQQAFPEIGPEPDELLYNRLAGWVVECGWPPEYRRELTKSIFDYGRKLGIRFIYSIDYATVPFRFKEKHPEFKYMPGNQYGESREISPDDPASRMVMKKYIGRLIEIFGTDHLYMCTPYAEIDVGKGSAEKNLELRIAASKGIMEVIREVDPKGIWVTDTWDMHCSDRWNRESVKKYLDSFPDDRIYLYDTAAEVKPLYRKYNHWHGKKWAFGIINCFAGKDTLHGKARYLIKAIREVSRCSTCNGVFMVPESTHHNIMYWDLATHLAWNPKGGRFEVYLNNFVRRRYGGQSTDEMYQAWLSIEEAVYRTPSHSLSEYVYKGHSWYKWHERVPLFNKDKALLLKEMAKLGREIRLLENALVVLLRNRHILKDNPLYAEDLVVIFRALAGRLYNRYAGEAFLAFSKADKAEFIRISNNAMQILQMIPEILSQNPSYSINRTIESACKVKGHHKQLPMLIRQACLNVGYVYNDVFEQFHGQYIPKTQSYFSLLEQKLGKRDKKVRPKELEEKFREIDNIYREKGWDAEKAVDGDAVSAVARNYRIFSSIPEGSGK